MNIITFVISTIKYPGPKSDWDTVRFSIPEGVCFFEKMDNYDKCEKSSVIAKKKQIPPTNKNNSNIFVVYVIPCLGLNTDDSIRGHYYNMIIHQIVDKMNTDYNNIYLIAHEKDFKEENDNIILCKIPFGEYYYDLEELALRKHLYLFQHRDKGKIYNFIEDIPDTEESLFDFDSCNSILRIIDNKGYMISFFYDVDKNDYNKYE